MPKLTILTYACLALLVGCVSSEPPSTSAESTQAETAEAPSGPEGAALADGSRIFGEAPSDRDLTALSAIAADPESFAGQVVKTTVYLKDMSEFPAMNEEYAQYFGDHRPARATVEVARLPMDVRVEIDAIAVTG